jgi:hypothetical protein
MPDKNSRHITFCLCPGIPLSCIASALIILSDVSSAEYSWDALLEFNGSVVGMAALWALAVAQA